MALRTDNVRSLVLYEPPLPASDDEPDTEDLLAEMTALHGDGESEQALVLFLRDIVKVPAAGLDALRSASNWRSRVDAVQTVIREERARRAYEFDASRFEELTTPTVLLAGNETSKYHENATAALSEALPDSRVVAFEGHGHAVMSTAPDLFVDEVVAFLRETN